MGPLHPDRPAHHRSFHQLHPPDTQDPGCPRDRLVHLRWNVRWPHPAVDGCRVRPRDREL